MYTMTWVRFGIGVYAHETCKNLISQRG